MQVGASVSPVNNSLCRLLSLLDNWMERNQNHRMVAGKKIDKYIYRSEFWHLSMCMFKNSAFLSCWSPLELVENMFA